MQSIGSELYDGSASLGRAESYVGLIVGGVISLILIIVAIYLLRQNQSDLVDGTAMVSEAQCTKHYDSKGNLSYDCNLEIKYVVSGKPYTGNITTMNILHEVGHTVNITYDSKDPTKVTAHKLRDKTLAYILLGVGVLIGGGSYLNYYMTSHYKAYAAVQGADTGLNLASDAFRMF